MSATVEEAFPVNGLTPDPPAPRSRVRAPTALLVALAVLLTAEVGARAVSSRLPVPQTWPTPEAQHKADQLSGWLHRHGRADVVVLGASMADDGVDPVVLANGIGPGAGVYNASLVGTPLNGLALWATAAVVPRARPKVVVLALSPVELNPGVPGIDGVYRTFADSAPIRRASGQETFMARLDRQASSVSALFRLRQVLRKPTSWSSGRSNGAPGLGQVNDPALTPDGMSTLGVGNPYETLFGKPVPEADRVAQYEGDLFRDFRIGGYQVGVLRSLVLALRAHQVNVIIVDLPLTADAVAYLPGHQASVDATASALQGVATATGAAFVGTGIWPTSDFADPGHLNGVGAARVSKLLTPWVQASLSGR